MAISRAKWAAFLLYSPALLDALPRTPEGVAQLSAFIRLVERRRTDHRTGRANRHAQRCRPSSVSPDDLRHDGVDPTLAGFGRLRPLDRGDVRLLGLGASRVERRTSVCRLEGCGEVGGHLDGPWRGVDLEVDHDLISAVDPGGGPLVGTERDHVLAAHHGDGAAVLVAVDRHLHGRRRPAPSASITSGGTSMPVLFPDRVIRRLEPHARVCHRSAKAGNTAQDTHVGYRHDFLPCSLRPHPCPNHDVRRRVVRRLPPLEGAARPTRRRYDYVDLEVVVDGADRAKAISGRTQIPVVVFPDGTHFTEPTDAELAAKLDEAIAA